MPTILTFDELEARLGSAEIKRRKRANAGRKGAAARLIHKDYALAGGPLDGQVVSLTGPSTAVLALRGCMGRYTHAENLSDPMSREVALRLDRFWRNATRLRRHEEARQLYWQDL